MVMKRKVVRLRSAVGIALIWLATVAGVSATAWVAIDRAGADISGAPVSSLSSLSTGTTVTPTTPVTDRSPADHATGTSSSPPVVRGSETATSTVQRDRSITVTGGQVSVRCTDATILLRIAQPDNGWRVDVKKAGPQVIDLAFEHGVKSAESGTRVSAVCSDSTAAFTILNEVTPHEETADDN